MPQHFAIERILSNFPEFGSEGLVNFLRFWNDPIRSDPIRSESDRIVWEKTKFSSVSFWNRSDPTFFADFSDSALKMLKNAAFSVKIDFDTADIFAFWVSNGYWYFDYNNYNNIGILALCKFKVKEQLIWIIIERPVDCSGSCGGAKQGREHKRLIMLCTRRGQSKGSRLSVCSRAEEKLAVQQLTLENTSERTKKSIQGPRRSPWEFHKFLKPAGEIFLVLVVSTASSSLQIVALQIERKAQ